MPLIFDILNSPLSCFGKRKLVFVLNTFNTRNYSGNLITRETPDKPLSNINKKVWRTQISRDCTNKYILAYLSRLGSRNFNKNILTESVDKSAGTTSQPLPRAGHMLFSAVQCRETSILDCLASSIHTWAISSVQLCDQLCSHLCNQWLMVRSPPFLLEALK